MGSRTSIGAGGARGKRRTNKREGEPLLRGNTVSEPGFKISMGRRSTERGLLASEGKEEGMDRAMRGGTRAIQEEKNEGPTAGSRTSPLLLVPR